MATQPIASDAASDFFSDLDPKSTALLLDVDGTIIDMGPTPHDVHVSDALCDSLRRLLAETGGALALVSGRPIRDLDRLFAPLRLPAIGGHGAEMRVSGAHIVQNAKLLPEAMRQWLAGMAPPGSGILPEDKGYSFALHFRGAPQREAPLRDLIERGRVNFPAESVDVLSGKAMLEVKRPGISKGIAVRALMTHEPFARRVPVFIGDDVTDESVFAILPEFGGRGYSVSRRFDGVAGVFESPMQVRSALQRLAAKGRSATA
jgi:trehalose 6-phosphate phosphatase